MADHPVRIDDTTKLAPGSFSHGIRPHLLNRNCGLVEQFFRDHEYRRCSENCKSESSKFNTFMERIRLLDPREYFKPLEEKLQLQEERRSERRRCFECFAALHRPCSDEAARKRVAAALAAALQAAVRDSLLVESSEHFAAAPMPMQMPMPMPNLGLAQDHTAGAKVVLSGVMAFLMTFLVVAMWYGNKVRRQGRERARVMKMKTGGKEEVALAMAGAGASYEEQAEREDGSVDDGSECYTD